MPTRWIWDLRLLQRHAGCVYRPWAVFMLPVMLVRISTITIAPWLGALDLVVQTALRPSCVVRARARCSASKSRWPMMASHWREGGIVVVRGIDLAARWISRARSCCP